MAGSVSLGYPVWVDGMEWTALLARQLTGGAATWDTNTSATAVNPLGGVFHGLGSPLKVTQEASPGMGVLVNAGYCAVPHLTQGHGVYLFGQTAQGTLTVASNSSGQTRVDIVLARVYDLGTSGSYCDVEIVEGTPGSGQPATPGTSILLAAVSVANGASSITNGNITDKRTFAVAPGGILPATSSAVLAPGQVMYNTGTGILERATAPLSFSVPFGPGSGTWTAPFTGNLTVSAYAPGGGGSQSTANQTDGSGGAGEFAQQVVAVTESTVYDWAVGSGGDGGSDSSGPTAGTGPTTFSGTGITTVTANPGQAGAASSGGGTGAGGTGSSNTDHSDGGAGTTNPSDPPVLGGAGGGGAAGPSGPGSPGSAPDGDQGGAGGAPGTGGGQGGQGGDYGQPGGAGQTPGGGGGQAGDGGGGILNGGDGGDGQLVLSWEITPSALTALGTADTELDEVPTSTGTSGSSGLTPGNGSSYGWGIGYGSTTYTGGFFGFGGSGFHADGTIAPEIEVQFTADGSTDFAIDAKWGMAVPEAAVDSASPSIPHGQCRILIMIDGTVLDTVYLECAATGGVTKPGDAGSFTYYTSAQLGTTPAAGTHTATLAIQTESTLSGQLSGAHVGNLASVSTSTDAFGSVPGYFTSALTQENCYLRVSGIAAAI